MSATVEKIRFFAGRRRNLKRNYVSRKANSQANLSSYEIYLRKRAARLKRAAEMSQNGEIEEYINWIKEIQTKLNLTNSEFAARIGISCQTVKLWYRKVGHFPSERSFRRLILLEREARIPVKTIKFIVGISIGVRKSPRCAKFANGNK